MAHRGIEPITLPWKRPEKGVSAAELGASFRIEQRDDGWHCTVKVGRRSEVLATGLRRLRDAQCRAEAHAATLPEVTAAVEKRAAEAAKPAAKERRPLAAKEAKAASVDVPASAAGEPPTFEQISDGCICGKIEGGTWIADPAGKVSVPAGTDPALAQEICRVAASHYTAQRKKMTPTPKAPPPASKTVAKSTSKAAAKSATTAAKPAKAAPKAAAKAAPKAAVKPAPKAAVKPAPKAAVKPAKATTKTASKAATTKAAAKSAKPDQKLDAAPTVAKRASKRKANAKGPRGRGKGTKAAAKAEKEEPVGKKSGKTTSKDKPCGCVAWTEAEGKTRGEAKHGAFVIEPEGKRHALYFYDPNGQSRHLQSGDAAKLRAAAEEMAGRGQPAPRAASGDDAALLKMFMAGAMEDET